MKVFKSSFDFEKLFFVFSFFWILLISSAAGSDLEKFENCRLIPSEWNDGDSFHVKLPDDREVVVRLYGVDCIETTIATRADLVRLREQQRYFGIAEAIGEEQDAIRLAIDFGNRATEEVERVLKEPFTVYTGFANARGRGRIPRIYGFVTTSEGKDLAEHLVSQGLARAHGVYRKTPAGEHHAEYRERMKDLEFQAAKFERGVWAKTDWDKFLEERKSLRKEDYELAEVIDSQKPALEYPIDVNQASHEELMTIRGIGKVMAGRIIEGRPYEELEDLMKVPGIGEKTFIRLQQFLMISNSNED